MKVLVIDDTESIRTVLRVLLEHEGHQVVAANSGADGVAVFRQNGGFNLVITDHDMPPGMNGEQVIAEIKRLKPRQPVMLFTANEELLLRLAKSQINFSLLRKPATMGEILAAVSAATNS